MRVGGSPPPSGTSLPPPPPVYPVLPRPPLPVASSCVDSTRGAHSLLHPPESVSGHPRIPEPCLPSPVASSPARFARHRAPPPPSSWQPARAGQYWRLGCHFLGPDVGGGGRVSRGCGQRRGAARVALKATKPTHPSSGTGKWDRGGAPWQPAHGPPGIPELSPGRSPTGLAGWGSRRGRRLRAGGEGGDIYFSRGSCDRKR